MGACIEIWQPDWIGRLEAYVLLGWSHEYAESLTMKGLCWESNIGMDVPCYVITSGTLWTLFSVGIIRIEWVC